MHLTKANRGSPSMQTVNEFLANYVDNNRVHPKSLISTFFGDLILPYGGVAWVETIAKVLMPLGINNRLVRTSLFRLVEEQWLQSTRSGRRSFYQLTEKGVSQTRLAEQLIYQTDQSEWDGAWTMVFLVMQPMSAEARSQLEQELMWLGFGVVSKNVLAHPTVPKEVVAKRVRALNLNRNVVCMRAETICDEAIGLEVNNRQMVEGCFSLDNTESKYRRYINLFSTLNSVKLVHDNDDFALLTLRLLLIDEYRRVILHDSHLPNELLPENWVGNVAYSLCKELYGKIQSRAENQYQKLVSKAGGISLKDPASSYFERFKQNVL